MTNFLDSVLTDPQYHFWYGSENSGPSKVDGSFSEVFSFKGSSGVCQFLCSFAISGILRLVIRCASYSEGYIYLGIGFTPADIFMNRSLDDKLWEISPAPDVWTNKKSTKVPLEHVVTHGNLLLRGHMSNGPRSIVHVEILEFNPMFGSLRSLIGGKQRIVDGKSLEMLRSPQNSQTNSKSAKNIQRFSCVVEIVNCLSVRLSKRNNWYCNSKENNALPLEILPLHRESLFVSGETNLEAMFCYEIISTDLALVIALKVGSGGKSFAAAFVPIPAVTEKKELKALMDENQWKTHDYKKNANANEGLQRIAIRNIRAEILMSEVLTYWNPNQE
ncbi:unnamed protein product [Allacma fusca]|uniref:Uncharacterized protein n=1 Tax=Allacma fusca TaxID=39272 RepID=A0A8J2LXM3_9HEXA|nr:unnamed protein product [Allacma fusca]